jgi:DNA primase
MMMGITEYGTDRLPAGPGIDEAEEIILVEGRADVLNLLKNGIKNVLGMAGTNIPESLKAIAAKKTVTAFVDGDRGGDLIIRGLTSSGVELDFVTKAPDGKEVEELAKKEIHKALRSKVAFEQVALEKEGNSPSPAEQTQAPRPTYQSRPSYPPRGNYPPRAATAEPPRVTETKKQRVTPELGKHFKNMLDDLIGTRGAYVLDKNLNILGKVPTTELESTIGSLGSGVYAVILDGEIEKPLAQAAEKSNVRYLVAQKFNMRPSETRVELLTPENL